MEFRCVCPDANVHTAIVLYDAQPKDDFVQYFSLINSVPKLFDLDDADFKKFQQCRNKLKEYWVFAEKERATILAKLEKSGSKLNEISEIEKGSTSGKNAVFTVGIDLVNSQHLERDLLRRNVKNGDIGRFSIENRNTYLIYTDNNTKIDEFPNVFKYLSGYKEELENRNEVLKGSYPWWRLERPRKKEIYDAKEKIIVPYRAESNRFAYDNDQLFNDGGDIRVVVIRDKGYDTKYVLGLLNSRLIDWYYGFIGKPKGNSREYFNVPLGKIPVIKAESNTQGKIAHLVSDITNFASSQDDCLKSLISLLQSKFDLPKPSTKLKNWPSLDFKGFLAELEKAKMPKLSLDEEAEWMGYFNKKKAEANALQSEIDRVDNEIDQMVYALYGLSEEEIGIVENS